MPWSSHEGKPWMAERIKKTKPGTLVDIGPGSGTYGRMLRPHLTGTYMTAIEVHAPYVARFKLDQLYDEVIVADVRTVPMLPVDAVILGDVLEHLPYLDALHLWKRIVQRSRHVFLSIPIVHYPQGPSEGNVHEAHLHDWTHEQVMALPGITDHQTFSEIGVYQARGKLA